MDRAELLQPSDAQRRVLVAMGFVSNALKNGDEGSPKWWLEGGEAVKANVAESLSRRGWIKFTGKWGGQPGVLGFTVTEAGRRALAHQEPDHAE